MHSKAERSERLTHPPAPAPLPQKLISADAVRLQGQLREALAPVLRVIASLRSIAATGMTSKAFGRLAKNYPGSTCEISSPSKYVLRRGQQPTTGTYPHGTAQRLCSVDRCLLCSPPWRCMRCMPGYTPSPLRTQVRGAGGRPLGSSLRGGAAASSSTGAAAV